MTPAQAIRAARGVWWDAVITRDKKLHRCDNDQCKKVIFPGQLYIDPFPGRAFAWRDNSDFHFCLECVGGANEPTTVPNSTNAGSDEAA